MAVEEGLPAADWIQLAGAGGAVLGAICGSDGVEGLKHGAFDIDAVVATH